MTTQADDGLDHWEALFAKNFLRWFHLNGSPALVEIVKIDKNVELTMRGGKKSKAPLIHLKQIQGKIDREQPSAERPGNIKPLVLNVTNGNSISDIHGTKPSQWPGKTIVLFQDETVLYDPDLKKKVTKPCIRIRAQVPSKAQPKQDAPADRQPGDEG